MPFWSKIQSQKELKDIVSEIDTMINKIEETVLSMENTVFHYYKTTKIKKTLIQYLVNIMYCKKNKR